MVPDPQYSYVTVRTLITIAQQNKPQKLVGYNADRVHLMIGPSTTSSQTSIDTVPPADGNSGWLVLGGLNGIYPFVIRQDDSPYLVIAEWWGLSTSFPQANPTIIVYETIRIPAKTTQVIAPVIQPSTALQLPQGEYVLADPIHEKLMQLNAKRARLCRA